MASSVAVRYACGSMLFNLAVSIRDEMMPQFSAPAS
jgi:hypothetical protein